LEESKKELTKQPALATELPIIDRWNGRV